MSTQRQTLGTLGGSRFNILSAANISCQYLTMLVTILTG